MPRAVNARVSDEEYEEWLGRLEDEAELPDNYDEFYRVLSGQVEAAAGLRYDYNNNQIKELWNFKEASADRFTDYGITEKIYHFAWGNEVRYTIEGFKGAFGYKRMKEIWDELKWAEQASEE